MMLMGVRTLVGTYDGTEDAAVMVDSVSGFAFGPLFDSPDDIHEFLSWLEGMPYAREEAAEAMGLTPQMIPDPRQSATDPRTWPDMGLEKVVVAWKRERDRV